MAAIEVGVTRLGANGRAEMALLGGVKKKTSDQEEAAGHCGLTKQNELLQERKIK